MSWLKESAKFAAEQKARDLKSTAAEIYALPHHKRHARLMEIPVGDRGMVRAYMDQLARIAQEENRRNNVKNNRRYMDKICGRKE